MDLVDHGEWVKYTPDRLPAGMPANVVHAKRTSDGKDWYTHVHDPKSFRPNSLKVTARWIETHEGFVITSAIRDASMLFPAGLLLLEFDYSGDDPFNELARKIIDRKTGKTRAAPPPPTIPDPMADILKRLEALEGKKP